MGESTFPCAEYLTAQFALSLSEKEKAEGLESGELDFEPPAVRSIKTTMAFEDLPPGVQAAIRRQLGAGEED